MFPFNSSALWMGSNGGKNGWKQEQGKHETLQGLWEVIKTRRRYDFRGSMIHTQKDWLSRRWKYWIKKVLIQSTLGNGLNQTRINETKLFHNPQPFWVQYSMILFIQIKQKWTLILVDPTSTGTMEGLGWIFLPMALVWCLCEGLAAYTLLKF